MKEVEKLLKQIEEKENGGNEQDDIDRIKSGDLTGLEEKYKQLIIAMIKSVEGLTYDRDTDFGRGFKYAVKLIKTKLIDKLKGV
jgi:hypothetical protein